MKPVQGFLFYIRHHLEPTMPNDILGGFEPHKLNGVNRVIYLDLCELGICHIHFKKNR